MTVHVFVGAGPANLHRALKISKIDPNSILIFIDKRLNVVSMQSSAPHINRAEGRANMFRFETDEVTDKLISDGVRKEDLKELIYERDFTGFQSGDETVFTQKKFTQIQIRDFQQVLFKTLLNLPIPIGFINHNIEPKSKDKGLSDEEICDEVLRFIQILKEQANLNDLITLDSSDIQIHVATGILSDNNTKDTLRYLPKTHESLATDSPDVKAMPVVPLHGTTTFYIDKKNGEFLNFLRDDQRSLDVTEWKFPLKKHGWKLIRPPRLRVFFANDILYIGTEIPASMKKMETTKFEKALTEFTRTIAGLVFPHLDTKKDLKVNEFLRSRFETQRGESGVAIQVFENQGKQITVYRHGDSRYLSHYQTGSGFVTAFLLNELFAEIYACKTFDEVVRFSIVKENEYKEKHGERVISLSESEMKEKIFFIHKKYPDNEALAMQMFKADLYMTFSRDIINSNKEKVARYFNALHNQELLELSKQLPWLIKKYNKYHSKSAQLRLEQFEGIDHRLAVIKILSTGNEKFISKFAPYILNIEDDVLTNKEKLKEEYYMHLLDYVQNAPPLKSNEQLHYLSALIAENPKVFLSNMMELKTQLEAMCLTKSSPRLWNDKDNSAILKFTKDLQEIINDQKLEPGLKNVSAFVLVTEAYGLGSSIIKNKILRAIENTAEKFVIKKPVRFHFNKSSGF